jgi:hypothetical protein
MKPLIGTTNVAAWHGPEREHEDSQPAPERAQRHPWRATGLEAPVFADPSGHRALTVGGIGVALAAATLAAVVIVVTAAIGFTSVPRSLPILVPRVVTARATTAVARRANHHRYATVVHLRSDGRERVSDAVADRRAHA